MLHSRRGDSKRITARNMIITIGLASVDNHDPQGNILPSFSLNQSSLSAWRNFASLANQNTPSEDFDQIARMCRLNWIFAGRTSESTLSDVAAQMLTGQRITIYIHKWKISRKVNSPGNVSWELI